MAVRTPIPVILSRDDETHQFDSLSSAAKFLRITAGEVSQARHTCRGWKITFLGEKCSRKSLQCKVFMFDMDGQFLQEFPSVHECARFLQYPANNLVEILKNRRRGRGRGVFKNKFMLRYQKNNDDTYDPLDFV